MDIFTQRNQLSHNTCELHLHHSPFLSRHRVWVYVLSNSWYLIHVYTYPNAVQLHSYSNQNPHNILHRIGEIHPKAHINLKRPQVAKAILSNENNAKDVLKILKMYYKAIILKTVWC